MPSSSPMAQPGLQESAQALATLQRLSVLRDQARHRALTEEEQAELEQETPCIHCGGHHVRACPRVRRIAFHAGSGQISEVEYWPHDRIDWTGVVFEDVGGEEDAAMMLVPADLVNRATTGTGKPRIEATVQLRHCYAAWLETANPEAVRS